MKARKRLSLSRTAGVIVALSLSWGGTSLAGASPTAAQPKSEASAATDRSAGTTQPNATSEKIFAAQKKTSTATATVPSVSLRRQNTKPPDPELEPEARARTLYEAGARAFSERRNAAAIVYFQRAVRILPNPKLTYNIGLAYEDMGDPGNAIFQYLSYLRQQPHSELRQEVLQRIERLEQQLAVSGVQQLSVSTSPPGAILKVNGIAEGITPYSGQFQPGSHSLSLQLPGHESQTTTVHLQPDHAFEVRLKMLRHAPISQQSQLSIRPLTWSLLAIGAGSLAGGIGFEIARSNAARDETAARTTTGSARASGAANAHQMASLSLLGFGSALMLAGGLLMLQDLLPPSLAEQTQALNFQLPCGHRFCGLSAGGQF